MGSTPTISLRDDEKFQRSCDDNFLLSQLNFHLFSFLHFFIKMTACTEEKVARVLPFHAFKIIKLNQVKFSCTPTHTRTHIQNS